MQDVPYIHDWIQPLPLVEGVSLLEWPKGVFPEPFESFIQELSRSTETPVELSALLTLAVVATASQKRYQVQIKSDYFEPVNIWSLVILPPASRKSRVYSEVISPLKSWECNQKILMEPLILEANSKRKTMEARIKEFRTLAGKAKDADFITLQEQIERIEKDLPEVRSFPQVWTSDVTPEHLGTLMSSNEEVMAVLNDEGGIFDILSGLYSDGKSNIDLFLQSHSASAVRVDRGSRPPIFMQRPVLTMGLTVQPEVVKNICGNQTFRGRGLLGRFLFAMPKSNIGSRSFEEHPIDSEIVKKYQAAIDAILAHPDLVTAEKRSQYPLQLSLEAYEKWLLYAKAIELMMAEDIGRLNHITDWAGKLPGLVARIAGLLHIMRFAHTQPWCHTISLEEMGAAIKIGHALINHALAVFDLLHEESATKIARSIYRWIVTERLTNFTQRECLRKFRRLKRAELRQGLEMLKEHEILKEREKKLTSGVGRPSDVFDVNPLIFDDK